VRETECTCGDEKEFGEASVHSARAFLRSEKKYFKFPKEIGSGVRVRVGFVQVC
jgi:hypothetical protein